MESGIFSIGPTESPASVIEGIGRIESQIRASKESIDHPAPASLPEPARTLLVEQYQTMRRAERADRDRYYALDEQASAAEAHWIDTRARAWEMYRFLKQSGIDVRGPDQEDAPDGA